MRYKKNPKDIENWRCREIEVFQYDGNLDGENVPGWVKEALNSGELNYQDGILFVTHYALQIRIGDYIVKKFPTRGYGDYAMLTEKLLNEEFDKIE